MIITRTPFRISFVGGGSDINEFYQHSTGAVLSATINKYMYIASHYFFDEDKIRVKYSRTETVNNVNNLKHPLVREALKKFKITGALEISSSADVPAGTGLGSSSSFIVGLLHNLYTVFGKFVTKAQLAEEACDIEINKLEEPIGKQDQYASAFGGLNLIQFHPSGEVYVDPIHLKEEIYKTLQRNLLMFYTGGEREASSILTVQKRNLKSKNNLENLKKMVELVWELRDTLYHGDLFHFGKILHKNWLLKQQLMSKIATPQIDKLYDKALENGAVGGKLLGAGGSGFMLFYCEEKNHKRLRAAMTPLKELRFKFENEGTKLIYVGDEYGRN
jgi:D-glycero-alpha-D-manno-heptose-7-phosphate kinase